MPDFFPIQLVPIARDVVRCREPSLCGVLLVESFRRAPTVGRAPGPSERRSVGGSTCRSGPGGLLPSRSAGHPRGCAPSTGAQGTRQGPIGKFVPSHWDRLIMEPGRVLRDLQGRALIPHRMVRGHDALVLHTQATGARRGKFQDRCRVLLSEGCDGLPCSQTVLLGSTHST